MSSHPSHSDSFDGSDRLASSNEAETSASNISQSSVSEADVSKVSTSKMSASGPNVPISANYAYPLSSVRFITPKPVRSDKPLFVFLPGMDGTGTLLRPQLDRLVPWFDIRCVSISPQDKTGWEALARQVSDLVAAEVSARTRKPIGHRVVTPPDKKGKNLKPLKGGRERPSNRRRSVYLCGESFGGCLAMQVLTQSPHLFDRVVLVNPASSFRRLPWMQLGPLITRQLPNVAYRFSSMGMVPFLMDPFRVAKRDRTALETAMGSVPAKTAAWRMSLLSEFDVARLPLERMTHPVLLIAGESDRLLPSKREVQSLQARFPNAKLTLLPYSSHACLLETETNLQKILQQQGFLTP